MRDVVGAIVGLGGDENARENGEAEEQKGSH
jgi:hypothetical protein